MFSFHHLYPDAPAAHKMTTPPKVADSAMIRVVASGSLMDIHPAQPCLGRSPVRLGASIATSCVNLVH